MAERSTCRAGPERAAYSASHCRDGYRRTVVQAVVVTESVPDILPDDVPGPWLFVESVDRAAVDRVDDRLEIGVTREDDPQGVGMQAPDPIEELRAAHAGHALVAHDHLDVIQCQQLEGLRPRPRRQDLISVLTQESAEQVEGVSVVIDQQQCPAGGVVRSPGARETLRLGQQQLHLRQGEWPAEVVALDLVAVM